MKMAAIRLPKQGFSSVRRSLTAIAILSLLTACAEVPVTGRKGLHLVPESQLLTMSFQQYDQVLKQSKLSADQKRVRMVRRVGQKVARAAEAFLRDSGRREQIKNYQWEYNLIQDDKVINAWCMPGGKIAVYTGILPFTKDETGLAVVLGHEVAHAIANHGNERMSQGLLANMGGIALSVALSQEPAQTQELFMAAFGVAANVGLILPYSRLHENEADRIGLLLMASAGYDPREAVPFWERMKEQGGARPPEFLSTHPAPATRIAKIKAAIPEALPYYQKSSR
jgi:predicted Zn-dependent protease